MENKLRELLLGTVLYDQAVKGVITDEDIDNRISELRFIQKEELLYLCKFNNISENTNGLVINRRVIHRLSGLTSFTILQPLQETLPYMIYLGDIHNTIKGQCDSCICNKEECCLHTFNPYFLQLLDQLGNENNPIDIYVEGDALLKLSNKNTIESDVNSYMFQLRMYDQYYYNCFKKVKYKDECPTVNSKWHYTDVRKVKNYIESNLYNTGIYLINLILEGDYMNLTIMINRLNDKHKELYNCITSLLCLNVKEFFNNFIKLNNKSIILKQINKYTYIDIVKEDIIKYIEYILNKLLLNGKSVITIKQYLLEFHKSC